MHTTAHSQIHSRYLWLTDGLTAMWPSLPFMSLGVWWAWTSLTFSGSLWLSDNEINGAWLSNLFTVSTLSFAVVFLLAAFLAQRGHLQQPMSNKLVMGSGIIAGIGCLLIILAGPYYLAQVVSITYIFFYAGAVLSGVGTSLVSLKCGILYGMLPPRRALAYAALSLLVCAFIYFAVFAMPKWTPIEHGPTFANILVFCLLPIVAALLACIPVPKNSNANPEVLTYEANVHKLPGSFAKFVVFSFFLCFIVTMIRSAVVTTHALATTVEGNNIIMLLRVVLAFAFILYSVRSDAHGISLGKLCSLVAVYSAIIIALIAALGGINNAWSVVVYFAASLFEFLMWCLLAFVVAQKRVAPITVFGFGRGFFMLGCGLGWMVGSIVEPFIIEDSYAIVVYIILAGIMLLLALGLFSERDFERLFSPVSEDELSLEDLFDIEARDAAEAEAKRAEKRGRFSRAIENISQTYALSSRESDTLRCLAMGYGSERMAETMGVKVNTARAHTHNVYVKLGVHSREELMLLVDNVVAEL